MPKNVQDLMNHYGSQRTPFLFIIDFEQERPIIYTQAEWEAHHIRFHIGNKLDRGRSESLPDQIELKRHPVDFPTYKKAFDYVVEEIGKGNSYLVNLTFPTPIDLNLNLLQIYEWSAAKYKLLFPDQFVCFSPETFVNIHNGIISTYPMKGTIDASIGNAESIILQDQKEFAEHVTVVDLLRNDLSMMAEKVKVKRFRYVDQLVTSDKPLLQVSSHIEGILPTNYQSQIGDIIFTMLPAGSISGAPKAKTLEIIHHAEIHRRGYYTGIMGYFDGENLASAVMIRFIEQSSAGLIYKSGGGITYRSEAIAEYQEMIDKVYVPIPGKYRPQRSSVSSSLLAQ